MLSILRQEPRLRQGRGLPATGPECHLQGSVSLWWGQVWFSVWLLPQEESPRVFVLEGTHPGASSLGARAQGQCS